MKRVLVLSLLLAATPPAFAQTEKKGGTHKATGVVTKMDKDKVTIRHEPVPSMNWPTMTMAFKVKDKAVMDKLKKDQKINFEFMQEGKDYVVTGVK
ncbi:MAG: copper-binding protein [Betaproteobacteria bacterium]